MFRLKQQLKFLRKKATPTKAFRHRLWVVLSAEFEKEGVCTHRRHFRYVSAGIATIVLLFGTVTGTYAYETPSVVEGHPLHFMKNGIEMMREKMMFTPEQKIQFHVDMMKRRLDESEFQMHLTQQAGQELEQAADQMDMTLEELLSRFPDPSSRAPWIDTLATHGERYEMIRSCVRGKGQSDNEQKSFDCPPPLAERATKWNLSEEETSRLFHGHGPMPCDFDGF